MRAIETCRTAALGGHVEKCDGCDFTRNAYNSCRNRHCPKCQNAERAKWLAARTAELLPVEYFHVVFTLPEQMAQIAFYNKETVYGILFRAAAETLLTIAADRNHLGAAIGFFAILHTWGQNLLHHPHLHCVIPGGGLSPDHERWISCPASSFPCACFPSCFAASSSNNWKTPSIETSSDSPVPSSRFTMPSPSSDCCARTRTATG